MNDNLNFENSPINCKIYNIPKGESIIIPCLNCIIFHIGANSGKFSIITTVGYQSDAVRSRISYINGDSNNGLTLDYQANEEGVNGIYTLTNNNSNSCEVVVVGIKGVSRI